jgi:hypothetical protein
MRDIIIRSDQPEEAVFSDEVADEALEAVAGAAQNAAGSITLVYCTGVYTCPT